MFHQLVVRVKGLTADSACQKDAELNARWLIRKRIKLFCGLSYDPINYKQTFRDNWNKVAPSYHAEWRFDIPKSEIIAVGRNVIVKPDFPEILKYRVDRNAPLPTGEPIDKLADE